MIPQLGFTEVILLAIIAIVVVGPKDLPRLMRTVGGYMSKIRAMGQEFKDAFEDMGAEDEIAAMRREIEELKQLGQLENLSDEAYAEDLRNLDKDLKAETQGHFKDEKPKNTDGDDE